MEIGCLMDLWEISEKEHHIDSKTLRELKFQMTLPKPTLYDERIEFSFQYKIRSGVTGLKTFLVATKFKNVFGE